MTPNLYTKTFTIAAGAPGLSDAVDLQNFAPVAIIMPNSWVTAGITMQASMDDVTYYNVYDDAGTERSMSAAASRFITLSSSDLIAARYLKLRSGTAGTPVNQTGGAIITMIVKPMPA